MTRITPAARDGEPIEFHDKGQTYRFVWYPPNEAPDGTPHGSAAICLTAANEAVIVSANGQSWELPGGRPEAGEDWRATLEREVLEEACAVVETARLLGFSRGLCLTGPQKGLVLVRALWVANVSLNPWEPQHEMNHRRLVPPETVLEELIFAAGHAPIYRRWLNEALSGECSPP